MSRPLFADCEADDRETPLEAIQDIAPILLAAADSLTTTQANMRIYDPYYCRGTIKDLLVSLGFCSENVFNDPIDCYKAQKSQDVPSFDFLLSNPPYSGDHIHRCMHYAVASGKPWALLLPLSTMLRPWYQAEVNGQQVLFVVPHCRYKFERNSSPTMISASHTHIPFVTIWYVGGFSRDIHDIVKSRWASYENIHSRAALAFNQEELPRKIRKLLPYAKVIHILLYCFHYLKMDMFH